MKPSTGPGNTRPTSRRFDQRGPGRHDRRVTGTGRHTSGRAIRARRAELGMRSQRALASRSGVSVRTIARLEGEQRVGETSESLIERALGWELGSIDAIRDGGEPTLTDPGTTAGEVGLRDDVERQIWEIRDLPEDLRWQYIYLRRARQEQEQSRQAQ